MQPWIVVLIVIVAAVVLGCIIGAVVGKYQLNKEYGSKRTLFSRKEKIICASAIVVGALCLCTGFFVGPTQSDDQEGDEFLPTGDMTDVMETPIGDMGEGFTFDDVEANTDNTADNIPTGDDGGEDLLASEDESGEEESSEDADKDKVDTEDQQAVPETRESTNTNAGGGNAVVRPSGGGVAIAVPVG